MAECERCDRFFSTWRGLEQHKANSPYHNICGDCNLDFASSLGLKEHWVQSPRHSYCQYCNTHCANDQDLIQHYDAEHGYKCCHTCRRVFKNEFGLKEHYRQSELHHYCPTCDRHFISESNLRAHLNSSAHRPKDVVCPFRGCGAKFVSRSALVAHLENGACASGVDRTAVNRYVRQFDTNNIITDPSRLLTGSSANPDQNIHYIATDASWNGRGFECCLCHNVYRSLNALNQHLASPRHQDQIYLCRGPSCGQRFNVLSALVQHIESEKCGVSKFKAVQNAMDSVLGQMGRLTMG
ncbi:hypothetical protein BDN70DRAFT_845083 [Pholiota conissans]|uniref:C2H2-type domain-containing protein n=1 Tax=Pholiota conissans TaxID=109636 RepID=A0A9P5YM32_9AGAR|nr:hypothetical protein BDN70DRAFT_845083 [Pholiota conissans]